LEAKEVEITDFRINVIVDPAQAPRGIATVERSLTQVENKADKMRGAIARALTGVSVAILVRELGQLADAYTNVQNRLRTVTDDQERLGVVTDEVFAIADRTRSAFDATAEVYSRVGLAAKELGRTELELLRFTESLNQAVILSGASADEARAGLIQLSQGLASGALRGDELRSVLEQLPVVADVISKSMGITRGELRQLGAEGKITADIVLDAFKGAREELEGRFAKSVPTISQSFTVLRNNLVQFVGEMNESKGASAGVSSAILVLADNIDDAANAALLLAGGVAAIKLTPIITDSATAASNFLQMSQAVVAGKAVMLGSAEAARLLALEEFHAAEAAAEHTAGVLASTRAQAANALVVTERSAADAARVLAAERIAILEAESAVATNALAVAQAEAAKTGAALGAVYTPHATTLGRLTVLEEEHIAATTALTAAEERAAIAAQSVTTARSSATVALEAEIAASKQATANAVVQAATTKQLTALEVENAAAEAVAAAAKAKLALATTKTTLAYKLMHQQFKVSPFLILIASAAAAVVALRKLDEYLDLVRDSQEAMQKGAKIGLSDFAKVGADITRLQGVAARVQTEIDRSFAETGKVDAENIRIRDRYAAQIAELIKKQDALKLNTAAAREAARKQREALAEANSEFGKTIEKLKQDAVLLQKSNREREVQAALLARIAAIEKDGATLNPEQKKEIEDLLRRNQVLEDQAGILDMLRGPQEEFTAKLAAAQALLKAGTITTEEFNKAIADLAANADGVDLAKIAVPGQAEGPDLGSSVQSLRDLIAESQKALEADLLRAEVLREIKGPIEELTARERILEELHKERTITDTEYANAIGNVRAQIAELAAASPEEKRANALMQVNDALDEQQRLLGMTNDARAVEVELLSIERDLREDGIALEPAEREALRTRLENLQALEHQGQLLESLRGPQQQYKLDQMALGKAFLTGALNIYEYAAALEALRLKQDETAKSTSVFADFAKNGFQQAGAAIVEFAVTGEDRFKEFTISLLQDLGRLLAQKALIALLDAFTGGGASAGTAFFGAFAGKQHGGPVEKGETYVVGERGRELFTAPSDGKIVPAGETAAILGAQQQAPIVNVSAPPAKVNIVNVSDPDEIPSGIESEAGQQAVLNVIRKHRRSVKGITG